MKFLDKIKTRIDACEVVSFDIFDTLLLRPYVKPTDLFLHMEAMEQLPLFAELRVKMEAFARTLHPEKEEITLDDIYQEMNVRFHFLKEKEMEMERRVLYPNPEIKELFEYALRVGKKVIICSDMYLPEEFLASVLQEKGYAGYFKLYLSSTLNKTKQQGSLYQHILDDLNVPASAMLHIGDNAHSDVRMAQRAGIAVWHYPKAIDRLLKQNVRAEAFLKLYENSYQASILLGLLAIYSLREKQNYWQDFGFKYAGPIVYGYMQWLQSQLKADGVKDVMFVARDGYTLQKVFDVLKSSDISSHYFYAPRITNLICNLDYTPQCHHGERAALVALRLILSYFREKDDFLKEATPDIQCAAEGEAFIQQHRALYESLAAQERRHYQQYCGQFHVDGDKVGLVDTVSIFLSAQKALATGLPEKSIRGYYWLTCERPPEDDSLLQTKQFQLTSHQEVLDWDVMELYMTAPTPPAERIDQGQVIFKEANAHERRRMEIYPDLSEGTVAYARFAHAIFRDMVIFRDCRLLNDWTNVLCLNPTESDKAAFETIFHARDADHSQYIPIPSMWFSQPESNMSAPWDEAEARVSRVRLFNAIPILKSVTQGGKSKHFLFHLIPLLTIKRKDIAPDCQKTSVFVFGVPLIKMMRRKRAGKQEVMKFYFLHLRLFTKRSEFC